jgi:hypothetical protein
MKTRQRQRFESYCLGLMQEHSKNAEICKAMGDQDLANYHWHKAEIARRSLLTEEKRAAENSKVVIRECLQLAKNLQERDNILAKLDAVGWREGKAWYVYRDEANRDLSAFLELLTKAAIATSEAGGDRS